MKRAPFKLKSGNNPDRAKLSGVKPTIKPTSADTASAYIYQQYGDRFEEGMGYEKFKKANEKLKGHRVTRKEAERSAKRELNKPSPNKLTSGKQRSDETYYMSKDGKKTTERLITKENRKKPGDYKEKMYTSVDSPKAMGYNDPTREVRVYKGKRKADKEGHTKKYKHKEVTYTKDDYGKITKKVTKSSKKKGQKTDKMSKTKTYKTKLGTAIASKRMKNIEKKSKKYSTR